METLSLSENRLLAKDRLRWLSIGYFVSGGMGALMVSFLLIHFSICIALSCMPEHTRDTSKPQTNIAQNVNPAVPSSIIKTRNSSGPPRFVFRIIAGVIGVIILIGWMLGGLTIYAGFCIRKRKCKLFIQIMAGVNCIWVPYGTLLGIATFLLFDLPSVKEEFQIVPAISG